MATATSKTLAETAKEWLGGQLRAGLLTYTILSAPHPKPSPRLSRSGSVFFSGVGYGKFRGDIQRESAKWPVKYPTGRLAVILECVLPKPKKTSFESPIGDCDNYAKAVLDALTSSKTWGDDRQVEALVSMKRWAERDEEPHVKITIGELK